MVRKAREIKFRLDANLDALGSCTDLALTNSGPRTPVGFAKGLPVRQAGLSEGETRLADLRIGQRGAATACAVLVEALGDFATPGRLRRLLRGSSRRFAVQAAVNAGDIAKGAIPGVFEQQRTTLRADACHGSVLRCGGARGGAERIAQAGGEAGDVKAGVAEQATPPAMCVKSERVTFPAAQSA